MRVSKSILTLSAGHFFVDAYSSMLGAFLPFLHRELNLTLTEAGILGGTLVFSSALMQPLYGYLADRIRHKIFAALGPAVAGVFICSMGRAPDFTSLLLLVALGGVGIAAFHPQGTAFIAESPHRRPGYQMSVFIASGMIGYALGPVYITSVVALAGLNHSYWAALPGILMSAYLLIHGPAPHKQETAPTQTRLRQHLRAKRRPLLALYLLVVLRSVNHLAFVAFLPLYFTMRGYSEVEGAEFLTLFLLAGGSAGFLGGVLSDHFGGKVVIMVSTLLYCPLLLGFLLTQGGLSILLCTLGGAFLLTTAPVNVAMAQRLVPEARGTVSALMMGFAWGVGGMFVPLVGFFGDIFGLQAVLVAGVSLTTPGFLLTFALPAHAEMKGASLQPPIHTLHPSPERILIPQAGLPLIRKSGATDGSDTPRTAKSDCQPS